VFQIYPFKFAKIKTKALSNLLSSPGLGDVSGSDEAF
jgi:hypothetical protein